MSIVGSLRRKGERERGGEGEREGVSKCSAFRRGVLEGLSANIGITFIGIRCGFKGPTFVKIDDGYDLRGSSMRVTR